MEFYTTTCVCYVCAQPWKMRTLSRWSDGYAEIASEIVSIDAWHCLTLPSVDEADRRALSLLRLVTKRPPTAPALAAWHAAQRCHANLCFGNGKWDFESRDDRPHSLHHYSFTIEKMRKDEKRWEKIRKDEKEQHVFKFLGSFLASFQASLALIPMAFQILEKILIRYPVTRKHLLVSTFVSPWK